MKAAGDVQLSVVFTDLRKGTSSLAAPVTVNVTLQRCAQGLGFSLGSLGCCVWPCGLGSGCSSWSSLFQDVGLQASHTQSLLPAPQETTKSHDACPCAHPQSALAQSLEAEGCVSLAVLANRLVLTTHT